MFGGVGKSAGWATILGTVGFVLSGSVSAKAADLGGNCCADLEERVAELEATTARKGNRKVSLTVSGWVNEQVLYWNDGTESNAYVGNNDQERSRFRFVGEAKIDKDWSAGYVIELGIRDTKSSGYNQNDDEGGAVGTTVGILDVRKSAWFLKSKTCGKFEVGREGSATYHLLDDADFTNTRLFADAESMPTIGAAGYFLRVGGVLTTLKFSNLLSPGATNTPGNGERPDIVRYETPDFKGFSAIAAWGEDDLWDVAGVFKGEIGDFKVAGRIGYAEYTDETAGPGSGHCISPNGVVNGAGLHCQEYGGSATIMHKPTGLYVYGAYGQKHDENRFDLVALGPNRQVDKDDRVWYIQPGIEKKWLPLGTTTIFGTYRRDDNGTSTGTYTAATLLPLPAGTYYNSGSEIKTIGGGVVQNIESAAMDLYLIYSHVDASFDAVNTATGISTKIDVDNLDLVQAGAMIKF
jgi:predicted porin